MDNGSNVGDLGYFEKKDNNLISFTMIDFFQAFCFFLMLVLSFVFSLKEKSAVLPKL